MSERKYPLTDYGIKVNTALMRMNKTQQWLIDELKKVLPDRFIDSSILNKVLTGRVNSVEIQTAINELVKEK